MRAIFFSLLLSSLFLSCHKNKDGTTGQCDTYLIIGSTNTPRTSTISAGITTIINGYGPDLCYSFSGTQLTQKEGKIIEIKLKGKRPCGPAICADAIYNVKDTVTINTPQTGQYYLQFFNGTSLFKTDTVTVN
jgi:hypothetical protein